MKFVIKKISVLMCVLMLFSFLSAGAVYASVSVSDGEAENVETVTVAGNPDFYPYEYYDEESGTYKGLFPDLLEIVSEKTGLDFEYVFAGETDQQLYQSKTGNAEVLTAFVKDDKTIEDYKLTYGATVVNGNSGNEEIGIAYTKFVKTGVDEQINEALSEISSDQILEILSKYMGGETEKETSSNLVYIIIAVLAVIVVVLVVVLIMINIKKRKNKQDEKIDKLTGLYTREQFERSFEKLAVDKYSAIYVIAYIAFDIVRVNSTYGEEAAEEQMKFAAEKLISMKSGTNDLLARYSGGGFVFMHVCSTDKETEEWISGLLKSINAYVKKYDKNYKPYFRAGVYCMEPGSWDRKSVVADALRSYQCAVDKDLQYYIADSKESAGNLIRNHLKSQISKAFGDDEFKQFFQPVVDTKTGKIIGAEALSRWFHPSMGILNPGRYVEMMEEEGTIFELDFLIFEKVCMTLETWQKENCDLWISTNFTRITISSRGFNEKIHEIVKKYDFDHSKLVFEITEECLENNVDLASRNVKTLSNMGFKIAIDDLGSGFTFFSDFVNYKIDMVKIDREIVLKTDTSSGRALMKGIADLCRNLGIKILAEGVETEEQLEIVRDIDCDFIQGFYFYKPMPETDFNEIRKKENWD